MALEKLGPYRIGETLGRGGMGTVYRGVNEDTDELAAVKVLSSVLAADEAFRERFQSEIETLKTLRHPNIVQLYGYGEQDGHLFYAMELVEGINLEEEIQNGRRFHWRETIRIGIETCRALKHAHDCGVIHRDLKPANLLLDRQDHIKLTDFGIAKLFGQTQMTAMGGVMGTADYMAPEQAEGRPVTPRSDLYSVGSVMYALLSGRPPFRGKTMGEVLHMLRYADPKPVRNRAPDVPPALEKIISQLLEKSPQKRIPTALALSNVLQATEFALSQTQRSEDADEIDKTFSEDPQAKQIQATDETLVEVSSPVDSKMPTRADSGSDRKSPIPQDELPVASRTEDHFTTVPASELGRSPATPTSPSEVGERVLVLFKWLIAMAVTAGIVSIVFVALQPPSANQLFHEIQQSASLNDSTQLAAAVDKIQQFVSQFPEDSRVSELNDLEEKLALDLLQKRYEVRARTQLDLHSLSAMERTYVGILRLVEPEIKALHLQAFLDLFAGQDDPSSQELDCLRLAKRQLDVLQETMATPYPADLDFLRTRLADAATLRESQPEKAAAIWKSIVRLYEYQSWATEVVEEARWQLRATEP
ncbi:MAG: serine/threonine protein kinase [Pirellulaceae bacterium]|nr:serine/threonine protein kinase [Pirellulaceae bacterium]